MKDRISYSSTGDRTYFLDDKEVTPEEYKARNQAKDEARLAEMLQAGQAPHGISDCTFMNGTANGRQFEGSQHQGDYYRGVAEAHGGSTTGKKYLSGLARFPGDPEAWVDSRGDVERVCAKRGWGCDGTITIAPKESLNPPTYTVPDVADDIVDKYTCQVAATLPDPERIDLPHLREQVKDRLSPKRKKKAVSKASV